MTAKHRLFATVVPLLCLPLLVALGEAAAVEGDEGLVPSIGVSVHRAGEHLLAGTRDLVLKLVADVEVVCDGALAAPGHHGAGGHSRLYGLLYPVLHQWLVHHGKHFLGHALGCGKEPGTVPRYWK